MSELKVDTISPNATSSVTFPSQVRMQSGSVVTGSTTNTGGITASGLIKSNTELESISLDINGDGDVSGTFTCGTLTCDGALNANTVYVQGVQIQPHIVAFARFDGSALSSTKNIEGFTDDGAGGITFDFTTPLEDTDYVVLATTNDSTNTIAVDSQLTDSVSLSNVPSAGCSILVLDVLVDELIDSLSPPLVALDDLSDVVITSPIGKQILYYTGFDWRNVSLSATDIASGTFDNARISSSNVTQHAGDIQIGNLNDVVTSGVVNGDALVYNSSTSQWEPGSPAAGSGTVTSVGLTVPSGLSVSGSPVTTSGTLSVTTALNGIVKGDGSGFSVATGGVDYANATHTHATSDVTSGTFADARIAQSNVTQHQAALAIAASQLTSGSLSISLTPDTDQAYDLGTEDFRWGTLHGDLEGSVIFRAKNANAGALALGDVVYISGYTSGDTPDVDLADANDSAKMPAFGIVSIGANSGAEVHVVTFGTLIGLDLNPATYSAGDAIYVSNTAGDFTNTPPTGESSGLQKIGVVIKPNTGGGTNGSVKVLGAGRTNAVPNLNSGNIFYGNGSNQAVPTALTSVAEAAGAVSTHAAVTSGVHGISSFGATLIDDADAAAARTTLGLGTAATSATGDFEASGSVSTHAAVTSGVHGISTFGATLVDDADAAAARTTLGAAATNHNHAASQITSGTFDDTRIASSNVTQHAGDIDIQDLGNVVPGLLSNNMFLAYNSTSSNWTGRAPAAARTALGITNVGSYTGQIETAADKTYTIDPGAATARTITGFYIKSDSGTCTATLKVGANTVKAASVSSASGDQTGLANTSVSTNDVITIVVTSNSSALDVIFSVEYSE